MSLKSASRISRPLRVPIDCAPRYKDWKYNVQRWWRCKRLVRPYHRKPFRRPWLAGRRLRQTLRTPQRQRRLWVSRPRRGLIALAKNPPLMIRQRRAAGRPRLTTRRYGGMCCSSSSIRLPARRLRLPSSKPARGTSRTTKPPTSAKKATNRRASGSTTRVKTTPSKRTQES
jgi:hypothetical protein